MSFFALLLAFLAEQVRPLPRSNAVHEAARAACRWAGHALDAGSRGYAVLGWLLVVLAPALAVWVVDALLWAVHPVLALLFHVLVLWFTLGFRQFSHHFTEIQFALARGDLNLARDHLQQWLRAGESRVSTENMSVAEVCRTAIEEGVVASHRNVYGVLFWYAVLPGATGAALYKLAGIARQEWGARTDGFGEVARQAFLILDWIPARMTAVGFAIVGNFEDAFYGWRQRAAAWDDPQRGVIVESAAGALGVRLAAVSSAWQPGRPVQEPDPGLVGPVQPASAASEFAAASEVPDEPVRAPDPATLQAAVGLLWRAVVLWMALLLLLSLVSWAS
ncbi:CobD/CbiB family protein [Pigmentiphaga humi]|uniref:Cobalamin biosynthesis protein CobD n=1 Tax=Pigmentiphaga humi TaxID=2478468 RepID=A0A3P4B087_9BURK|nr:CobD/CbiB family protein [Pigmentiphaga humi]VCU68976.1 CobD/CbiB family protein [Pigmentiphaga humi]